MKQAIILTSLLLATSLYSLPIEAALKDIESKRTSNSKMFSNENGSHTFKIYSSPVHYKEGNAWKDIDTRITTYGKKGIDYACLTNSAKIYFRGGNVVNIQKSGREAVFSLQSITRNGNEILTGSNNDVILQENELVHKYPAGANVIYSVLTSGLMWEAVMPRPISDEKIRINSTFSKEI